MLEVGITGIEIPAWQVGAVLLFPVAYIINSFTSWGTGLWGEENREYYLRYWFTVLILHWVSTIGVILLVLVSGYGIGDIGLKVPDAPLLLVTVVVVAVGILSYYSEVIGAEPVPESVLTGKREVGTVPITEKERRFMFFNLGVTAGICEEVIYRGFAITALVGAGSPIWLAVILSSLSFVFVHGMAPIKSPIAGIFYFVVGVIMAVIFISTGNLLICMALHGGFNLLTVTNETKEKLEEAEDEKKNKTSPA